MRETESWLLPAQTDRERMLDMDQRLQRPRQLAFGVLGVALLVLGPWIGWWTIAPLAIAALLFLAADRLIAVSDRPEFGILAAWLAAQAIIGVSVLVAWDENTPVMSWFAIPIVTLSARFSLRGVVIGVALTLAMMLAIAFGSHPGEVADHPPILVMPIAVVLCVAVLSTALMRSDQEHRDEAIIDPLTSMLNRKSLEPRAAEIAAQAQVSGAPVGVVIVDIDHFKHVNDTLGHATGDAVLRDVAYTIRKGLRAFELAYRLGGEEFLLLLPGANPPMTAGIAERIRSHVAAAHYPDGCKVTVSCGFSATAPGERFEFAEQYERADRYLYDAKRNGRNRVEGPAGKLEAIASVS